MSLRKEVLFAAIFSVIAGVAIFLYASKAECTWCGSAACYSSAGCYADCLCLKTDSTLGTCVSLN